MDHFWKMTCFLHIFQKMELCLVLKQAQDASTDCHSKGGRDSERD